jgi:hypothetical protein
VIRKHSPWEGQGRGFESCRRASVAALRGTWLPLLLCALAAAVVVKALP